MSTLPSVPPPSAAEPAQTPPPSAPSWRLAATLAGAGALAGFVLVAAFQWAEPRILAHQARALQVAVEEVLASPERYETLYLVDGRLTTALPQGVDSMKVERVYRGFDADGRVIGYAMTGAEPGFQDVIRLIFGYDAANRRLLGMKVLESKETPGLGDKIEKDSAFVGAFRGVPAPMAAVKPGTGTGAEGEVDMITGATISSRAVIGIINRRLERMAPLVEAYETSATAAGAAEEAGARKGGSS